MGRVTGAVGDPGAPVHAVKADVLHARAYLSRVAEPANVALWGFVRDVGPVDAARAIRRGRDLPDQVRSATAARAGIDPEVDLAAADRHGIRLVSPESDEWPHFAFAALEHAGVARLDEQRRFRTAAASAEAGEHGEPVPPLALWVRGPAELATLGVRSVGIVGARASTRYGEQVARQFAHGLARSGFVVVSGGAYGIDRAAHGGALEGGGCTVLVSAGGLDAPYPSGNARVYDAVLANGLLISESPPGSPPKRRRFLTRNRLIAALSTGTIMVEAGARSGAINTLGHCDRLDRPIMVVPGPVTSPMSAGCHWALSTDRWASTLVTSVADVLGVIGGASELPDGRSGAGLTGPAGVTDHRVAVLDGLDPSCRAVFDGFPTGRTVPTDELIFRSGLPVSEVLQALPRLELAGLVQRSGNSFRIA